MPSNKTLHTNRRPALGFVLSTGLLDAGQPHHVIVRAAVGEIGVLHKNEKCPPRAAREGPARPLRAPTSAVS
jgi:hypothetical protein